MKKTYIFIAVIAIIVIVIVSIKDNKSNTLNIGVISPLSGSASAYGEPALNSILIAQKEINDSGGILGKKVNLIIEDGKCDGTTSATAAHKLIDLDKVPVILGGHCSTETLAIAPIAEKSKTIILASITSSPNVTNSGEYIFRNSPSSEFFTAKSADYAFAKGYKKIAALYENKDFPVGVFNAFRDQFTKNGGQIVSNDAFSSDVNDLRTYLKKIATQKPDAILFAAQGPSLSVTFYKQMSELGLLNKYPIIAGPQSVSPMINQQTNGLLNNPNIVATDGYVNPQDQKTKDFIKKYIDSYHEIPPTNLAYLATSYDALFMIKEAMESCKSYSNTKCIKEYLSNIKDWVGAAGKITLGSHSSPVTPIGLHYFERDGKESYSELK
jgi:branched-chain amino acid transport system substrate-binding protein